MSDSHFVICTANESFEDLQLLKVYRQVPDPTAAEEGLVRVIDDSGEDYLYPREAFLALPSDIEHELENVALSA
jgi:hypothetical protein